MKVILLPQAQEDLDAIFDPLLSRVIRRLQLPEATPALGAPMMGRFHGYRSTVVGLFRIVYRVRRRRTTEVVEVAYHPALSTRTARLIVSARRGRS